ncbi:SRPBCC family protein [Streptomyces sp. t39]|uniref:SRPBCC family protein n=1 Tax=Streptomyces sp. t39 TaxID=1828156 RepID=UPI0011CDCBC5|nr:SRPBCC family protein [Streptomyces sp. t39]TXS44736.1 SRPBCC family protein [Streptomyces sp. t39]
MAVFRIGRTTELAAAECWRRVTDWPAHSAGVPLTSVSVTTPGPVGVGTVFVARTAAGPAAFDDPMEIVRWEPPAPGRAGACRLEKRGRTVTGWAEIEVRAVGTGSVVLWVEDLRVRGLPRALDPLLAHAGRLVFGRTLDGLLAGRAGQ